MCECYQTQCEAGEKGGREHDPHAGRETLMRETKVRSCGRYCIANFPLRAYTACSTIKQLSIGRSPAGSCGRLQARQGQGEPASCRQTTAAVQQATDLPRQRGRRPARRGGAAIDAGSLL